MAEDRDDAQRTEEPTQRRLDDARRKGDVAKSQEMASFVVLASGALALTMFSGMATRTFTQHFLVFLERPEELSLDAGGAAIIFHQVGWGLFMLVAPAIFLVLACAL